MIGLLILLACGLRCVGAQHLMQVPPQRVVVNNFAPGPSAPTQASQPQFRIVQTFNGPFRLLANPSQNTNVGGPSPQASSERVAFRPVAGQALATHQFNTALQNPFSHQGPVITTFRNSGTNQQGIQGPPHQVFQGPSHQLFQGPSHQVFQGPSHQVFQGPSHQVFQGPSHQVFQGPSHQVFQGPSHQAFEGPPHQAFQGPPNQVFQGPPHQAQQGSSHRVFQGNQEPQDRRPPELQIANGQQFPTFQNPNQPFNGLAFQQQQVEQFRQAQAANGFFNNPFRTTTQPHFPFHASPPTLPARLTTRPGPGPINTLGNGSPPSSETSTAPTNFREPIQQNFQRPQGFSSEVVSSTERFHPLGPPVPSSTEQFGPLGPPGFHPTTARNPATQHFQGQQQHSPSPAFSQQSQFNRSPDGFNFPQPHPSFVPQTSSEFQRPFPATRPGPGPSPNPGGNVQNLNFPESLEDSSPGNGLTGSRERFPPHGSNFPSSVEFPRAPISFFGHGFTGFPDHPSQRPTFNSLESGVEETSSEIPQKPVSSSAEPDHQTKNSLEIQPVSFQTSQPPTPGHLIQNQFTSEELKPEVLKITDDDRRLSTPSFPTEAPSVSQHDKHFFGPSGTLTSPADHPSTTAISSEAFADTDSRAPSQTAVPDFQDQQEIRIETPTQRSTSPVTPSPTIPETPSGTTEAFVELQNTVTPTQKPQSPSFAAILNNLQKLPGGEDQLQRPLSSRGTVKHSTVPLRRARPTRLRRIRTTTKRPTPKEDPQQELQTEQQRNSLQVVRDEFHRIPSSPPVVGSDAKSCNPSSCQLPNCFCGGNQQIPGGLKPTEVPQMVLLTFDDSVNEINYGFYNSLLNDGRNNPNGCPISGTFYVSHEWTDYGKIQTLYALGHEIASHSITHSDGASFTKERWDKEIDGQKRILSALGRVRLEDIKGMRAPFLQGGGNKQFAMLYEANFTYDSSIPANLNNPPTWPYTLDYRMPHECGIPPCPNKAFPGVWEVPMVMWEDLNGGRCAMADACHNPSDARGVYDMLVKNFKRHYTTNRAPFGMFYHYAWFTHPHQQEGFLAFIDALNKLPDVYFVTNSQMLDWMRNPTPLSRIKNFKPWQCKSFLADTCSAPKRCTYRFKGDERQFPTCQPCPEKYPWLESYGSLRVTS